MASEKKKQRKLLSVLSRALVIVVFSFFLTYIITVMAGSADFTKAFSERQALSDFDGDIATAEALSTVHYDNLYAVAARMEYLQSAEAVRAVAESYIGSPQFGDLRYYTGGRAFAANGIEIEREHSGAEMIEALSASRAPGCTGVYFDSLEEKHCIAFFVPVRGSAYVDGVLSILPVRDIISLSSLESGPAAALLIDGGGAVFASTVDAQFPYTTGNHFYSFLDGLPLDAAQRAAVYATARTGEKGATTIDLPGGQYTVCMAPLAGFGGQLSLITFTPNSGMTAPELIYLRHVLNISIIAIVTLAVGILYALFYYRKTQRALVVAESTDATLGCPNAAQFEHTAADLLQVRGRTRYAVALLEIRQYTYLTGKIGEGEMTELLKYVAQVLQTFCHAREAYGYLGDGRFAMLLERDHENSVRDRTRLIEAVVNKHSILGASHSKRKFNIGVSLVQEGKRQGIKELLGYAAIACEKAKNDLSIPFVVFNEEIRHEEQHNAAIEAEMESALTNHEFRLFLQPKYNVADDRIDSAEALVRWFDTKKGDYRFPGEFIGLFETNGFIIKLDHFMYAETLKYLSQAAEKGEKVVPVAVNVSMVTASQDNFLSFYVEQKKKHRIPDGFITIEFTESFAMEDYYKIRHIVDTLHKNGIRCSLDDFGTGYSSFGALKNIPFDEVKIDRTFLAPGFDRRTDDAVLSTILSLARSLGMRVVQEGVETKEMFDRAVAQGCDVIQGYYYAKAIPVEEYRIFVGTNTSIKYKSLVK